MVLRIAAALLAVIMTLVFVGCVAGWIIFCPPVHTPGSAAAVQALHKWVIASVVSGILAVLMWALAEEYYGG